MIAECGNLLQSRLITLFIRTISSNMLTVSNNWVQMNPQPDPSTVVIVKRSYNSLKRQNDYKRRITWIESAPSTLKIKQKHLAIVEYIGIFPDEICIHGNSKSSNSEYVRTATDVMANIQEKVQNTETTGSVHDTNIKWNNISTTGLETSSNTK